MGLDMACAFGFARFFDMYDESWKLDGELQTKIFQCFDMCLFSWGLVTALPLRLLVTAIPDVNTVFITSCAMALVECGTARFMLHKAAKSMRNKTGRPLLLAKKRVAM